MYYLKEGYRRTRYFHSAHSMHVNDPKMSQGVRECERLFVSMCPEDGHVTCPECIPPLVEWVLESDTSFLQYRKEKRVKKWDEWLSAHRGCMMKTRQTIVPRGKKVNGVMRHDQPVCVQFIKKRYVFVFLGNQNCPTVMLWKYYAVCVTNGQVKTSVIIALIQPTRNIDNFF